MLPLCHAYSSWTKQLCTNTDTFLQEKGTKMTWHMSAVKEACCTCPSTSACLQEELSPVSMPVAVTRQGCQALTARWAGSSAACTPGFAWVPGWQLSSWLIYRGPPQSQSFSSLPFESLHIVPPVGNQGAPQLASPARSAMLNLVSIQKSFSVHTQTFTDLNYASVCSCFACGTALW